MKSPQVKLIGGDQLSQLWRLPAIFEGSGNKGTAPVFEMPPGQMPASTNHQQDNDGKGPRL
jgi:hypothetical protein